MKFDRNPIINENSILSAGWLPFYEWSGGSYYTPSPLLIIGQSSFMVFKKFHAILIPEFTIIAKFLEQPRISEREGP